LSRRICAAALGGGGLFCLLSYAPNRNAGAVEATNSSFVALQVNL
jgi:hypothetical protein